MSRENIQQPIFKSFLVADDWGLSPGVNMGILELSQKRILKAVSLMANEEHLEFKLDLLKTVPNVELGIHFNLTHGHFLTSWKKRSPQELLIYSLNPHKKTQFQEEVANEFKAQLNRLKSFNLKITRFDGHHHIHMIPKIMKLIAPIAKKNGLKRTRLALNPKILFSTKAPLFFMSLISKRVVKSYKIKYRDFLYPELDDFKKATHLYSSFLSKDNVEVVTHPASNNDMDQISHPDPYGAGRVIEYQCLIRLSNKHSSSQDGLSVADQGFLTP